MRRGDGGLEAQPEPQSRIEAGDMLVAIGPPPALEQLEGLFQPLAVTST